MVGRGWQFVYEFLTFYKETRYPVDKVTDVKFCQFIKKLAQRIEVVLRGGNPF